MTPRPANVGTKLTRRAAISLARELGEWAAHTGSYAHGWAAMVDAGNPVGDAATYRVQGPVRTRGRFHGFTMAGARARNHARLVPERLDFYRHSARDGRPAPTTADDEAFRARMEAWGRAKWGSRFTLPALDYHDQEQDGRPASAPAPLPAPSAPGTVAKGAAAGAAPAAEPPPQAQPDQAAAGAGGGFGMGTDTDDDEAQAGAVGQPELDRAWAVGAARKLRGALDASTMRRRETDQASGRYVNRASLARVALGACTRPFERLAHAHAPSTAINLALDGSGSMYHVGADGTSKIDAVRRAAHAVSEACGRTVALRMVRFRDTVRELSGWRATPAQRLSQLRHMAPSGGTQTHEAAMDGVRALMARREKRRALVIFTDGDVYYQGADHRSDTYRACSTMWDEAAALALANGIEVHAIISCDPSRFDWYRRQWARLPAPFNRDIAAVPIGAAAGQGIIDAVERVMRAELVRAS